MYVDNNKIRPFNCQTKLQHSTILHMTMVNGWFINRVLYNKVKYLLLIAIRMTGVWMNGVLLYFILVISSGQPQNIPFFVNCVGAFKKACAEEAFREYVVVCPLKVITLYTLLWLVGVIPLG